MNLAPGNVVNAGELNELLPGFDEAQWSWQALALRKGAVTPFHCKKLKPPKCPSPLRNVGRRVEKRCGV